MPIPIQGETTIRALSISQDGQWFVSGDEKGMLTLWDKTGKQIGESIKAHDKAVISVAIFTDGKDIKIVSGGDDKKIKLWNWINNQPPTQPQFEKQLNGNVYAVAFNSDGNRIVSGSGDGVVRVWDLQKGEVIFQSSATNFILIRSVAFSPDPQILASGNNKGIIQLWKPKQGTKELEPYPNELRGHSGNVYSLAFINQESLISSGGDGTVRVWDIKNNPSDDAILEDWLDNACKRLRYHPTFNNESKESKVARETCGKK